MNMETQSEDMDEPATSLQDFFQDMNKHIEEWQQLMEKGESLFDSIYALWKESVPKVFQFEKGENDVPHWPYNEHEPSLFQLLERFICGGDDLKSMMNRLSSSPLCGRTLKMGEPAYSCRECGTDPTCVLCAFCFKNSVHQHHKYKMHTSQGNGRCDCGDVEAWSSGPFCDTHQETKRKHDENSNMFPEDVARRARVVFEIVLSYAFELLTHKHSPSLPSNLIKSRDTHPLDFKDTYCVVLYNDESHTFDQVFEAMNRVMNDVYRDLVNRVDREGRAVIKVCSFQQCTEIKGEVERCTSRQNIQPLKVQVLHVDVVAHQIFALKLLDWMESVVQTSAGFRREFASVFLESSSPSTAERVLMEDANMWIAARLAWHRVIMAGLLIEYDIKKSFAKVFTKRYGNITKEYIRDDHDRRVSVLSLTVQLYTLPTVAHYLIAEERALFILWNTVASEFTPKVKDKKFAFERHSMSQMSRRTDPFFRILETFFDIKYLLVLEPKVWTDELRRGFLSGLSTMLDLMSYMQEMEPFKRQVGQHVEYEPEYETGFAIHKSMAQIYPFVVDWCSTDRVVLIKAYRMVLGKLVECSPMDPQPVRQVIELANHSANCIVYDPAVEPVSIYLPLSRLLAGLHLALDKFGLTFDSPELQPANRQTKPTPHLLLEPALRLQVMIAQVWAGMWRRNGFSILTQVAKYRSAGNRNEMQDRDICMIQICASLIESNEFLIILLHKFNLMKWADPNFLDTRDPDTLGNTTRIVEEFLGLLVIIVSERYTPGIGKVTEDDQMKKEIIQLLCAGPLSHSELYRAFPFGHKHMQETRIESVVDEVADFKRPANKVGVYELKEHHYADCNVFYYHYDAEDRSHAEEILRKKNKERNGMDCCPPPPLPQLCPQFTMLLNLLQCDVMLHILKVILERSTHIGAQYSSELQLHMALHLIGYALQEQEQDPEGFIKFTDRASQWDIECLLEELLNCAPLETLKDLLKWVLTKYRSVKKGCATPLDLISSPPESQADHLANKDKEWRAKMAAEKRAKIMAQMAAMQKNFMKENASLFQHEKENEDDAQDEDMDTEECNQKPPVAIGPEQSPSQCQVEHYTCILCQEEQAVSCTGSALVLAAYVQTSVVMARKLDESVFPQGLFLSANLGPAPHASTCGHVMHSTCWKQYYDNVQAKESRRPYRLRQPASFDIENNEFLCPLCNCLSNAVLPLVPQIPLIYSHSKVDKSGSSCISFKSWLLDLKRSPHFERDTELNSGAIKLMDTLTQSLPKANPAPSKPQTVADLQSDCIATALSTQSDLKSSKVSQPGSLGKKQSEPAGEESDTSPYHSDSDESNGVKNAKRMQLQPVSSPSSSKSNTSNSIPNLPTVIISDDLVNMILRFAERIDTKSNKSTAYDHQNTSDPDLTPLKAWQCCAYTIHSLEVLLRDEGKPLLGNLSLRQHDCLKGLVRMMALLTTAWNKPLLASTHAHVIFTLLVNNHPDQSCLLDWDSFGVLVPLVFLLAKYPVPSGAGYEIYSLRLTLFMEIMKCLISLCHDAVEKNSRVCDADQSGKQNTTNLMEVDEEESPQESSSLSSDDLVVMSELVELLCNKLSISSSILPKPTEIWEKVKEYCQPFLRCSVLFFHFLTTVPARDVLTLQGGDTFDNMCSYLGLSGCWRDILFDDTMQALAKHWTNHPRIFELFMRKDSQIFSSPLKINRLVTLPEDYSEVLCSVLEFYCHDRVESRCPTMCLVCGDMLCSQNSCCVHRLGSIQVGSCTYHAVKCGAGCGLFLQVRKCQVLVLALPNRGTFMTPPYVDDYGETDQGLKRGNRLQLSPELYKELEHIWLSHGIREYVSRSMDKGAPQLAGLWNEL